MSGAPRTAQIARAIWNRAAIAVGMSDRELALEVCRELGEIESEYTLWAKDALMAGNPATGAPPDDGSPAERGSLKRLPARFAGRCGKCARAINVGTPIAYDPTTKRAFHEECAVR